MINRIRTIIDCSQDEPAKQSFKDECDINKIMAKFQRTGVINHYAKHAPEYGDASPIEYLDALQTVATANEMFAELPSSVRKRFSNSPEEFLEFVQNPENLDECRKMGLANPAATTADRSATTITPSPTKREKVAEVAPEASSD